MFKVLFRSFVYKQANRNKRSLSSKLWKLNIILEIHRKAYAHYLLVTNLQNNNGENNNEGNSKQKPYMILHNPYSISSFGIERHDISRSNNKIFIYLEFQSKFQFQEANVSTWYLQG